MAATMKTGDTHEVIVVDDLTRTQLVQYAGASGDYNPLHTDEVYATKVAGYPTVFAHGMLTMAMTGRVVTDLFGADNVTRFGARFVSQVWPGDTLTVTATVGDITDGVAEVSLSTRNQTGDEVLSGYASAKVGRR
jgi:acyl dehydratase